MMSRSVAWKVIVGLAGTLLIGVVMTNGVAKPMEIGSALSDVLAIDKNEGALSEGTSVVLILRAVDCLSCSVPNRSLRRIRPEGVDLLAITSSADVGVVQQNLDLQRLHFKLYTVGDGHFRRVFGSTTLPALALAVDDTVRQIVSLDPASMDANGDSIRGAIKHLLARVGN